MTREKALEGIREFINQLLKNSGNIINAPPKPSRISSSKKSEEQKTNTSILNNTLLTTTTSRRSLNLHMAAPPINLTCRKFSGETGEDPVEWVREFNRVKSVYDWTDDDN